jgi:peptide deformylase
MATLPIRMFGDPVLRSRARDVPKVTDALRTLMGQMIETMRLAPGVGLAAPQVGILKRVIVWENDEEQGQLANPVIVDQKGQIEGDEGCLSIPGLTYPVTRFQWVRVEGLNRDGEPQTVEAEELTARILQHEIDHLNGVLFIDRLPPELRREALARLRELAMAGGRIDSPSAP